MKPDYRIIYEPSGRAREYSPLAVNPYLGCLHACKYCFAKRRMSPEQRKRWDTDPNAKPYFVQKLRWKAERMKGDDREILLSFQGDVYQPAETELELTRQAIKILIQNNLRFTILTKGGTRAVRDFDLLERYDKARFGTTLLFLDDRPRAYWEPGAQTIENRIQAIREAKQRGIKTWVSLEPVIYPHEAINVIKRLYPIVDHWKVGKINYHPEIENRVDWVSFREEAESLLQKLGADYYIKNDLRNL